jgi:uncharacterized lipoprotein YddW (UPF0748 family)
MINNIYNLNLNTVILQVRSNADAIYNSSIYPYSSYISGEEGVYFYDVLDYFIEVAHKKKIKVIAWINPYRIRTNSDISSISYNSPAYKYIGTDTIYINNGIYFNPASSEVTDLIIKGVEEVLEYNIDGLLFDDYFYPSDDIDNIEYQEYISNNDYISREQYHLNTINNMIREVHKVCSNKNILFGVSPDGNIDNNYNKNYCDVKSWMESNNYIDFIMPQIYYGFYNSTRGYLDVIREWESLLKNDYVKLYVALAFYKIGMEDKYAVDGKYEWLRYNNIIMREVILSRNLKNYRGFSLFRYEFVFDSNSYTTNTLEELNNLKKIMK